MLKLQILDSFLSLRKHLIKIIKTVYITLVVVSNMVDQGRIILQIFWPMQPLFRYFK